jgi:hypothetical protein
MSENKQKKKRKKQENDTENTELTSWQWYIKSWKDSLQTERENMAQMETRRQKIGYFLYYHALHLLIAFIIVFVIIYGVVSMVTHKDLAYNCVVVNDSYNDTFKSTLTNELSDCIDYNPKKETVTVSCFSTDISNYDAGYYGGDTGMQSIYMQMLSYQIDTMLADKDIISWFALDDNYCNLKDTLPSDLYKEVEPYVLTFADTTGEEQPYGLDISGTKVYKDGESNLETPVLAIFNTTTHLEESIEVIRQIFELN